jgi:hypothetical protein
MHSPRNQFPNLGIGRATIKNLPTSILSAEPAGKSEHVECLGDLANACMFQQIAEDCDLL